MSCACFHPRVGFLYAAGRTLSSIYPDVLLDGTTSSDDTSTTATSHFSLLHKRRSTATAPLSPHHHRPMKRIVYNMSTLPSPGARCGQDAIELICHGKVAVIAIGNVFYAIPGIEETIVPSSSSLVSPSVETTSASPATSATVTTTTTTTLKKDHHHHNHQYQTTQNMTKIISFAQSSQVHPVICIDMKDPSVEDGWSCVFCASGRECTIVDVNVWNNGGSMMGGGGGLATSTTLAEDINNVSCSPPRHNVITTVASPILAAASSWPFIAVLTSDGLISIRSPSCLAIPLRTVEVGTRPNDYFVLRTLRHDDDDEEDSNTYVIGEEEKEQHHPTPTKTSGTNAMISLSMKQQQQQPWLVAISYSGEGKVIQCQPDTSQDLADRVMRLSIDAFGANGFPRSELAEALNASFTSTSYVGPEPTAYARSLLKQYLEAVLGLADFDSGGMSGWPTTNEIEVSRRRGRSGARDDDDDDYNDDTTATDQLNIGGAFDEAGRTMASSSSPSTSKKLTLASNNRTSMLSSSSPAALVVGSALLCLVCSQLSPPNASLANRTAKACAVKVGVVFAGAGSMTTATVGVCEAIAEKLLREASVFTLSRGSSPAPISHSFTNNQRLSSKNTPGTEFAEAAVWLLRSCGKHDRAIEILHERLHQHASSSSSTVSTASDDEYGVVGKSGAWSQIKFESYTATHLSELWGSNDDQGCRLVLRSTATRGLLENNPRLGLSVFTATHPHNENQWKNTWARDDPLAHPSYPLQVVELLKSVNPAVPYDAKDTSFGEASTPDEEKSPSSPEEGKIPLPLESGRALAVAYLESAIGISTGRPTVTDAFDSLPQDESFAEQVANLHDELSYLLLEGVIAELGDEDKTSDTELGQIYRGKLRRLLRWPNAKLHSDRLLASLPSSFRQEHALLLGRLGRHEDALRILYCDLQSLDLALEYCDVRYERQRAQMEFEKINRREGAAVPGVLPVMKDCAYLPLVRVALQSDPDQERGTTAAIQVLALRRSSIDRAAALRLLPQNVPVAAVARPFLIPALVDSESQVRRLKVTAALQRAKYVSLKKQLTEAQIKSQSTLHSVPVFRSLKLGDPLHSTKAYKARPAHSASSTFPEVVIIKHFFPRHLVIQAKITNSAPSIDGRTLGDVAFVVAESSEEAIQPTVQVPLKALPFRSTGSAWCLLAAAPQRMDGTAILACELRYTVVAVDATTGAPLSFSGGMATSGMGRTYVEELEDMDVHAGHFLA